MILNPNSLSITRSLVGEFQVINEYRKESVRTGVFEIQTNSQNLFVKIHNRLSRWNPEVFAYENWIPALKTFAPNLIYAFNDGTEFGIITSPVQGKTINEFHITDEKTLEKAYYKAGELLRVLHDNFEGTYFGIPSRDGTPFDKNAKTSSVDFITSSLENTLKQGYDKGLLSDNDKKLVEWSINNCDVFSESKPVPTNWDYSPQNWMVDSNGDFTGIIDFENMLWGIDVSSFGVVIERYTYDRPNLRQAIFEGYGLENDLKRQMEIRIISVNIAIGDIVYGSSINDSRIASLGRNLLDSLI